MNDVTFHMDYLSINLYCGMKDFFPIWEQFFSASFGFLSDTERRTAFYKKNVCGLAGVTILAKPVQKAKEGDFITLTIKGEGSKCISLDCRCWYTRLSLNPTPSKRRKGCANCPNQVGGYLSIFYNRRHLDE